MRRYLWIVSAVFPNAVTSTYVTFSFFSPFEVYTLFVARPNLQSAVPLCVYFSSGARVRLPRRMTLLKLLMV